MKTAKAFCPANISCIFRLYETKGVKGSLGAGFTIDKGVYSQVRKSRRTIIYLNGKRVEFPTVESVIEKISDQFISANIKSDVPLGCGFGVSGASALATAYAVNKLLGLGLPNKKLALIAHNSEVENSTGRGDVGGQFNGGIMIKTKIGKPLEVQQLDIKAGKIFYKVFGEIDTQEIIDDEKKADLINLAGDKALRKLMATRKITFEKLIEVSKQFSIDSGLLGDKKLINLINEIENRGGGASMVMLGKSIFSNIPFKNCEEASITYEGARAL